MKRSLAASLVASAAIVACNPTTTVREQDHGGPSQPLTGETDARVAPARGNAEGLYTRLRPNHPAFSPSAMDRVDDAVIEAAAHMHAHSDHADDGSASLEHDDSANRRAWLIVDRAANLAAMEASPVAVERRALLEALSRQSETWTAGSLALRSLHTNETRTVQLYDRSGRMLTDAVDGISQSMFDWRSHEVRSIDTRLIAILYRVSRHFEKPLTLVSGYRVRGVNASDGSRHGAAKAADIIISGVSSREVSEYVEATFCQVGVGVYPNSGFVHIDVRDRSYFWTDRSGSNQRSREHARSPAVVARCEDDPTIQTVRISEREYYLPAR